MITASEIIQGSMSLLGVLALGEELDGEVAADALPLLNGMVESWSIDRLFIVTAQEQVISVSPGTASLTIGTGGNINTDRPPRLEDGAFFRIGNVDYGMDQVNRVQFESIGVKSIQASYPAVYYYDQNLPLGTISFYPVPAGTCELHLPIMVALQQFADLTTSYTLAPGYKRALMYSFAEEIGPSYRPVSNDIRVIAQSARRAIRKINAHIPQLSLPARGESRFNVLSNQFVNR